MNWKDVITNDNLGFSTDNFYYFEGINVTDPVTGTFGANLNTEIIQEQKVITGGIPAEYVGAAGLISTVITKSGSNNYSGSANYFFQNDNLVGGQQAQPGRELQHAATPRSPIGGPLLKDKAVGLRQLPLPKRHRRRQRTGHARCCCDGRDDAEAGLRQGHLGTDAERHVQLHVPERSVRARAARPIRRCRTAATASASRAATTTPATYSRVWNAILIDGALQQARCGNHRLRGRPRRPATRWRSSARTSARWPTSSWAASGRTSRRPVRRCRPRARRSGSGQGQPLQGRYEWAQHEDIRDLLYLPESDRVAVHVDREPYLGAGVTAASIANSTLWSTRQFNVNNASDFNGLITRDQHAAEPRARSTRRMTPTATARSPRRSSGTSLVFNSTAGNPNGDSSTTTASLQTATGAQDTAGPRQRLLRPGRVQHRTA